MTQLDRSSAPTTSGDRGRPLTRAARLAGAGLTRRWKLPPARNEVRLLRDLAVPMRDGVDLLADVYLPDTGGAHPTVLLRTPYGRGPQFGWIMALPYAMRGYAVVLQSVRGTFGSAGLFQPVVNEAADGQDTVAWLREQSWFGGQLATLGPSYLGYAQWALALDPPPELQAMIVHIGPHDLARAGMNDGAFELASLATWTETIAHQERVGAVRGAVRLMTAEKRLAPALQQLPLAGLVDTFGGAPVPFFGDWVAHPQLSDPFWDRYRATAAVETSTVPTLLVGGWQDWFLEQTLDQYAELHRRGVDVGLTVGPWAHLSFDTAESTRESLAWLDTHLQGRPQRRPDPVRVHVTGGGRWHGLQTWPPAGTTDRSWSLAEDGRLSDEEFGTGETVFRYDPLDPTPSVGGRVLARRAGRQDNTGLEARPDVVTFTTEPLAADADLLGGARVRLEVVSDNRFADLFVRLTDVDPEGRSVNVTDRLVRLDPTGDGTPIAGTPDAATPDDVPRTVELTLPDAAHRFAAGHRVRLQISGGAHPRYARNLGTGAPLGEGTDGVPVTHTVEHAGSRLTLPLG